MNFKIGDRVIYEEKDIDGKDLQGKIVAVAVNNVEMMTTYLALLDSGVYVNFTSDNLKWCEAGETALVQQEIQLSSF
ncbi:MAG: hypothetical protein JW762_13095 [Dehalococcoidales bacterium]|nr:hypothetical protein [Dehalococcoidales bacterium]